MPWLLNEDAALKAKLQGIVVTDTNDPNGRNVPVRYRLPETEISDLTFPIIVISHNGWYLANEREHRGKMPLPYAPEGQQPWWDDSLGPAHAEFDPTDSPYNMFIPLPYNFDYQIEVYCRFMHEHTIPIVSALAQYNRLNAKFGFLDIPQDGTKRTMQLLGGPDLETLKDENDKRLFKISYLVRVFSELVPAVVSEVLATAINLDFTVYQSTHDITGSALQDARGILSVGASMAWNIS